MLIVDYIVTVKRQFGVFLLIAAANYGRYAVVLPNVTVEAVTALTHLQHVCLLLLPHLLTLPQHLRRVFQRGTWARLHIVEVGTLGHAGHLHFVKGHRAVLGLVVGICLIDQGLL